MTPSRKKKMAAQGQYPLGRAVAVVSGGGILQHLHGHAMLGGQEDRDKEGRNLSVER